MLTRFALLALALTACSAAGDPTTAALEARGNDLWLSPGQAGYEEQTKWGLPLPADFSVTVTDRETVQVVCRENARILGITPPVGVEYAGCSWGAAVTLSEYRGAERDSAVLLHEMGHVLGAHHIEDPEACPVGAQGQFVMCAWGHHVPELAPEDFAQIPGSIPLKSE